MPSIPPYPIEIPTSLLHHSLNRLDRNESERVIGAQAGKTPRRAEGGDAYSSCSYSIEKSSDRANLRDNRWANIFSCKFTCAREKVAAHLTQTHHCRHCS